MELKYRIIFAAGIFIAVLLLIISFFNFRSKVSYSGGKKTAGNIYVREEAYFKKRLFLYRILSAVIYLSCIATIVILSYIIARPYREEKISKDRYNRDIMLCIDVSKSMDEVNGYLVDSLINTVKKMDGERFGITLFNTTPVVLSPLTEDYDYIIECLNNLKKALEVKKAGYDPQADSKTKQDYLYYVSYIMQGTIYMSDELGGSLVGDGLAGAAYNFSDEPERTKIIIYSTDNDIDGTPTLTLKEAGDLCISEKIKVFGIGPDIMRNRLYDEMKEVVEGTGGKMYIAEDEATVKNIVYDIEKTTKSLIKGDIETRIIEITRLPFILLLIAVTCMFIATKITRR